MDITKSEKYVKKEKAKAEFAVFCRKVRMYIAAHPGVTSFEIRDAIGGRYDMALAKMLGMGIIRYEKAQLNDSSVNFPTTSCNRWFVVPQ